MEKVRTDNAEKLEQMRVTVDERLQGTLEQRLGESFKMVGDQLEKVFRGIGEMQTLATGVGDLKKMLSNVKMRGHGAKYPWAICLNKYCLMINTNETSR